MLSVELRIGSANCVATTTICHTGVRNRRKDGTRVDMRGESNRGCEMFCKGCLRNIGICFLRRRGWFLGFLGVIFHF